MKIYYDVPVDIAARHDAIKYAVQLELHTSNATPSIQTIMNNADRIANFILGPAPGPISYTWATISKCHCPEDSCICPYGPCSFGQYLPLTLCQCIKNHPTCSCLTPIIN